MDEAQLRTPGQTFRRNYWWSFLVFTIATVIGLIPAFIDSREGGGWLYAGFWLMALIWMPAAVSLWRWARMPKGMGVALSAAIWLLALSYVGMVAVDWMPIF